MPDLNMLMLMFGPHNSGLNLQLLVGGELDLVRSDLDLVGGELDLVGGELDLVEGELDLVQSKWGRTRWGRTRHGAKPADTYCTYTAVFVPEVLYTCTLNINFCRLQQSLCRHATLRETERNSLELYLVFQE